jgi:hypothetical protein
MGNQLITKEVKRLDAPAVLHLPSDDKVGRLSAEIPSRQKVLCRGSQSSEQSSATLLSCAEHNLDFFGRTELFGRVECRLRRIYFHIEQAKASTLKQADADLGAALDISRQRLIIASRKRYSLIAGRNTLFRPSRTLTSPRSGRRLIRWWCDKVATNHQPHRVIFPVEIRLLCTRGRDTYRSPFPF